MLLARDACLSNAYLQRMFQTPRRTGSHLVKSWVDSTDFRQPTVWHVTHGVCGCQNRHCLQEEEPAELVLGIGREHLQSWPPACGKASCLGVATAGKSHSTLGDRHWPTPGWPGRDRSSSVSLGVARAGPGRAPGTRSMGLVLHESNKKQVQIQIAGSRSQFNPSLDSKNLCSFRRAKPNLLVQPNS